jgi:hypothetical protein
VRDVKQFSYVQNYVVVENMAYVGGKGETFVCLHV